MSNEFLFQTTVAQKVLIQKLSEAIDECRKAGIQMFTTDGENALVCYNSLYFDKGPYTEKENEDWLEIPLDKCDKIDGNLLDVDFISWGCCAELYAHMKP